MISIHELDPFYHPIDGDSLITIGPESMNFSLPPLGLFSPCDVYLPPHLALDETSL